MGLSMARKEKGMGILTEISLAKYSLVTSQARAKSCRVATRASTFAILSRKFQFWRLFLTIFSSVASSVQGWLHVRFSSLAGDVTKLEIIA